MIVNKKYVTPIRVLKYPNKRLDKVEYEEILHGSKYGNFICTYSFYRIR